MPWKSAHEKMAAFTVVCQVAFTSLWLHSAIAQISKVAEKVIGKVSLLSVLKLNPEVVGMTPRAMAGSCAICGIARENRPSRKNTKMSYLYDVVAPTLLYLLVLVALQSVLLFPSYNDH